jgi:hypothetical protein
MALIIDKPTVYGPTVRAKYWRSTEHGINSQRMVAEIKWGGWATAEDAAIEDSRPLTTHIQAVTREQLRPVMLTEFGGTLFDSTFAGLYALGKTDPFFEDAIDG